MNARLKEELKEQYHCKPKLTLIKNKGVVVDNSKLPESCRYCQIKEEMNTYGGALW